MKIAFAKIGTGPQAMVFLHGWNNDSSIWQSFVQGLNPSAYSFFLLDLPGFGATDVPPTAWTILDYAQAIADFCHKQQLTDIVLVGHSLGGRVSIALASQFPQLVNKLILIGAPGVPVELSWRNKVWRFLAQASKQLTSWLPVQLSSPIRNFFRRQIYQADYQQSQLMMEIRNQAIDLDLTPYLTKIKTPTLVIYGELDQQYPQIVAKVMNQLLSTSILSIIPEAGHFPFLTNAHTVRHLLLAFMHDENF